jgi:hypothetical protein
VSPKSDFGRSAYGLFIIVSVDEWSFSGIGLYLSRHPGIDNFNATVTGPGVFADEAEETTKWKYLRSSATYYFVPIAVETMDASCAETSDLLHQPSRRIAVVT